jgi:sugar (pentulose or hexulose) kinase
MAVMSRSEPVRPEAYTSARNNDRPGQRYRGTTGSHPVCAALKAMCYQTRDVLETMRKDSGMDIKTLKVDGGAAGSWPQARCN